ncbi:MAG: hypothetical protein ACK5P7_04450 [Bdellovibrio sp.]
MEVLDSANGIIGGEKAQTTSKIQASTVLVLINDRPSAPSFTAKLPPGTNRFNVAIMHLSTTQPAGSSIYDDRQDLEDHHRFTAGFACMSRPV